MYLTISREDNENMNNQLTTHSNAVHHFTKLEIYYRSYYFFPRSTANVISQHILMNNSLDIRRLTITFCIFCVILFDFS